MKPGNLSERIKVPNPAATRDEDSIYAHVGSSMCAFLMFDEEKGICTNGKKTVYL